MEPLACFITWTTYGTWLPGDERGWWDEGTSGVQSPDPHLAELVGMSMTEAAVVLSDEQRSLVDREIHSTCRDRGWFLHECNVRTNHVHVVVAAIGRDGETVREQIKAKCSRALSDHAGIPPTSGTNGRKKWWTEKGNIRKLFDEISLAAAIAYVQNQ